MTSLVSLPADLSRPQPLSFFSSTLGLGSCRGVLAAHVLTSWNAALSALFPASASSVAEVGCSRCHSPLRREKKRQRENTYTHSVVTRV